MNEHNDDSRESTNLVSITNLNDDFEGGEHFVDDSGEKEKLDILPKTGKTIAFDGKNINMVLEKLRRELDIL